MIRILISVTGYLLVLQVSYECKYGFMIVGNGTRMCGTDKVLIMTMVMKMMKMVMVTVTVMMSMTYSE